MTRREAREHCFKMLFCQDFYPAEEKEEQLERYFDAPVEDVTGKDGADEVLHQVDLEGADKTALEARVEAIMKKIPELDEKICLWSWPRNSAETGPRPLSTGSWRSWWKKDPNKIKAGEQLWREYIQSRR